MKRATALLCIALVGCGGLPASPPTGSTLTGTFVGAGLGSVAARAMDASDRRIAATALDILPDGDSSAWRNRETGDSFVFTPTRSFERRGVRCRDFRLVVAVGGRTDGIGASACRQPDGTWRITG